MATYHPQLWEPSCLPLSGAPDTCEMDLSRGPRTHRRSVLLGRAPCNQLELRLYTVMFTPKSQKELATQGRSACFNQHDASESPARTLEVWIPLLVWTLMGQSLGNRRGGATSIPIWKREEFAASSLETGNTGLTQPPQGALVSPQGDDERRRQQQDEQTTGRAGACTSRAEGKLRSSRELQCCGV